MRILTVTVLASLVFICHAWAGEVKIVDAKGVQQGKSWTFSVTLEHDDSGWEHYADAWRVVSAKGKLFGKRTLFHPHENEQPFTRSLSRVSILDPTAPVYIEAHDNLHGWAKERFEVRLQAP